jgi:hypothetical protein
MEDVRDSHTRKRGERSIEAENKKVEAKEERESKWQKALENVEAAAGDAQFSALKRDVEEQKGPVEGGHVVTSLIFMLLVCWALFFHLAVPAATSYNSSNSLYFVIFT